MIPIANHVWQSTLFAALAGLLALVLRKNRAQVRHWLWLAASVKFLIPFSLLVSAGSQVEWLAAPVEMPPTVAVAMEQVNLTFAPLGTLETGESTRPYWLAGVWAIGFAGIVALWCSRWRTMRTAVRSAARVEIAAPIPVMCSTALIEPGVFGILRPVLLLPEGIWKRLSPQQFSAILAHELCHARRRDNLAAAIHMIVEALFWFHPLVWWIGARMVDERERACDEEVLRQGSQPEVYAEGILNVCKFYLQSPLECAAGVSGADLRKRIESIMSNRVLHGLTWSSRMLLAAAGMVAVGLPVVIGVMNAPRSYAQTELKFEVASIKRAVADPGGPRALGISPIPGGGIRARIPVKVLITYAYKIQDFQLSGGPSWIATDLYEINAKPEKPDGADADGERTRQRVKMLLAERFHLAVKNETKETSVYVLSVAKGGHKMKPDEEGNGGVRNDWGLIHGIGAPMPFLAQALTNVLRRPVLDQTGLPGKFTFKLEFRPEDFGPIEKLGVPMPVQNTADDSRPSIFASVQQQLGLRLEAQKGPVAAVVVERIERPSEN